MADYIYDLLVETLKFGPEALNIFLKTHPEIDPNIPNSRGQLILTKCVLQRKTQEILVLLADQRIDPNAIGGLIGKRETALHKAVFYGFLEGIEILIKDPRTNINCLNEEGCTPLSIAVRSTCRDSVKVTELLLKGGANPNVIQKWEWEDGSGYQKMTPAHIAATDAIFYNQFETLGLLVFYGADLNARANDLHDGTRYYTVRELYEHELYFHLAKEKGAVIEMTVAEAMLKFDEVVNKSLPSQHPTQSLYRVNVRPLSTTSLIQ